MSGQLWRIRCTIVVKFTEQVEMREDKYWVYFYAELESYQYFALFACRRQHSPLDSVAWGESQYTLLRSRYHHTQQIQVSVWKQLGYEIIIHTFGIRWRMSDQKIKIFINFYLLDLRKFHHHIIQKFFKKVQIKFRKFNISKITSLIFKKPVQLLGLLTLLGLCFYLFKDFFFIAHRYWNLLWITRRPAKYAHIQRGSARSHLLFVHSQLQVLIRWAHSDFQQMSDHCSGMVSA